MSTATIIMVVLICAGCALFIAGLAVVGYRAFGLLKAAKKAGIASRDEAASLVERARALQPRVREITKKSEVVAERLKTISTTTGELDYLKDEIDRSAGRLSHIKS